MKTIVIGSGGREHAIAWTLAQSPLVSEVVCIPGNGGTATESKCRNIQIPVSDIGPVVEACRAELGGLSDGSFVVVGPEDPLAAGIADRLADAGLAVVGPRSAGAMLEASKDTAKRFMQKYGVACAKSETYTDVHEAVAAIGRINGPVVVKADGLAAGKGVVVTAEPDEAIRAVRDFMVDRTLGGAGIKVVIEEYLEGEEVSILAAVSVTPDSAAAGKAAIVPFVSARDHKRLRDGAEGPNTGGMGAIAPAPGVDETILSQFRTDILEPTLRGLEAEGYDYRGFIFFGVMVTASGPKLLEYNVRLGDPETQAVLPLMDFDFALLCRAIIDGTLADFSVSWKPGFVCAPVAVSRGYPGSYPKGLPVSIDQAMLDRAGAKILFAGTALNHRAPVSRSGETPLPAGQLVTSGGRVLASVARGDTVEEARARAYKAFEGVSFDGMFFRKDIGLPGAAVAGHLERRW